MNNATILCLKDISITVTELCIIDKLLLTKSSCFQNRAMNNVYKFSRFNPNIL